MLTSRTKTVFSVFLLVFFLFSSGTLSLAEDRTRDPNASIPKPPGDRALLDFQKVQKLNNELAVKHFTEVIQKTPKDASAYQKRGKAHSALKDYKSAMQDYDKALEIDPNLTDAHVGRAVVRYMQNDDDGSWQDVHKAESLGGKFWPSFMEALKTRSKRDK